MLNALLAILACSAAHAAPSFLVGADRVTPGKDKVAVEYAPGQKIHLEAGFFDEGDPAKLVRDPEGSYDWQLRCGDGDCNGLALTPEDHGRYLEIPSDAPANLRVLISHTRPDGSVDGQGELDLAPMHTDGVPTAAHASMVSALTDRESLSSSPGDEVKAPRFRRPEHQSGNQYQSHEGSARAGGDRGRGSSERQSGSSSVGSRGSRGGGGGGSSDDSGDYSSHRSRRSRRSSMDSSYERYSGGGGAPASTNGSFNRDKEVPVLSCRNVSGADGLNRVVCEDQVHKVLRLKTKARAKALAKPVKKAAAKKPGKKKHF